MTCCSLDLVLQSFNLSVVCVVPSKDWYPTSTVTYNLPRWLFLSLPNMHLHELSLSLSLVHPLIYVGHSVYIDRYFQCLGPQEISLGNFQRTDRPTFLSLNWNGQFPSLLVWHLHTKWPKWTQTSWTSRFCVCVQQQALTQTPIAALPHQADG